MKNERNQKIDMTWEYAFKKSLPIMAGYVVLGMGFGVLLETKGYGVGWAFLMSCFIYAGSMLGAVLNFNSTGIDFSMTALFLVVFVEQWRSTKNHISAVVGVGASLICLLIFGADQKTPAYITYLSSVLPYAIMGMLVIYCLRNVSLVTAPHGLPDFWFFN